MKEIAKQLRERASYFLKVNYDLGADALRAQIWKIGCGFMLEHYGEMDVDKFSSPYTGKHEMKMKLFCYDKDMSPIETILDMQKVRYRPANLREFIAFGAKYLKGRHQKKPIVILGTLWKDKKSLMHAVLEDDELHPTKYFKDKRGKKWSKRTCFLAVYKKPKRK